MIERADVERFVPAAGREYDVVVVGAGPAGLGAALAAARNGASVLLLESRSLFGGTAQACLWMPWDGLPGASERRGGGILPLFTDKVHSLGPEAARVEPRCNQSLAVHPEYLSLAALQLLEETGCHYRLYSPVAVVHRDGDKISGVQVTCKDGSHVFSGRVIVDATGDADVAYLAGEKTDKGRSGDGWLMPATLTFALCNVDTERLFAFAPGMLDSRDDPFKTIITEARGEYCTATWYVFDPSTAPGVVSVNNGGPYGVGVVDGTSVPDLVVAQRLGVQVAVDFVRLAREKQIPGLENCSLMRVSPHVALRETRRLVGEYVLTADDMMQGARFDDAVLRIPESTFDHGNLALTTRRMRTPATDYPYRCALPRRTENLLVAGKCTSVSHEVLTAFRGMADMMALGETIGVAAALSCRRGTGPKEISAGDVRSALVSNGVRWSE